MHFNYQETQHCTKPNTTIETQCYIFSSAANLSNPQPLTTKKTLLYYLFSSNSINKKLKLKLKLKYSHTFLGYLPRNLFSFLIFCHSTRNSFLPLSPYSFHLINPKPLYFSSLFSLTPSSSRSSAHFASDIFFFFLSQVHIHDHFFL